MTEAVDFARSIAPDVPPAPAYLSLVDPRGLTAAARAGLDRMASGNFTGDEAEVRADIAGWCLMHAHIQAGLGGTERMSERQAFIVAPDWNIPDDGPPDDRIRAARILARTPVLLARAAGMPDGYRPPKLTIVSPMAPGFSRSTEETAAFPIVAAAIIALSVAVSAAALAWIATQAAPVVDNALARAANLRATVQADAQALAVLDKHQEAEQAAGKLLPLNDAEKQVLGELEARQRKLATPPPPVRGSESSSLWGGLAVAAGLVAVALAFRH